MQKSFSFYNFAHSLCTFTYRIGLLLIVGIVTSCGTDQSEEVDGYPLLGAGFGINNTTLLTNDLTKTRNYYADTLGFDIPDSSKFRKGLAEGSVITRIRFPDMSSIELLSLEDSLVTSNTPSFFASFLAKSEGIGMFSLSSSSVDTTFSWLNSRGFKMDSVKAYRTSTKSPEGWAWDDGESQERSLDFENNSSPTYFPRFVEDMGSDYQEMIKLRKTYYGFYRSFSDHPNGVIGIVNLQIAVDSFEIARNTYRNMGLKELTYNPTEKQASFQLKRQQKLELVAPTSADDELTKFLNERGSGIFSIRFEVENLDSTYHFLSQKLPDEALSLDSLNNNLRLTVSRKYAKGVQLEFVKEPEAQALMAQQLKIGDKLDSLASQNAAGMYKKYCALCHAENREGYAADHAPSLRSKSLLGTSKNNNYMRYTIQFGRANTAMGGYLSSQGGPMEYIEIELLLQWLYEQAEIEEAIELSREPVAGDIDLGRKVYAKNCVVCHGANGEGITAPALGNPMLLATATDEFLKYAITNGRDGTPMVAFKDSLKEEEINGLTAFLRSRASGWNKPKGDSVTIPMPDQYVLNPENTAPKFNLRENLYVSAEQVNKAIQDSSRMIILDARSKVAWRQMHIPGSVPVPYYEEPEAFIEDIPNDSTSIVVYCACPHAASQRVINTLKRYGYKNTAILDEGILVWAQMGYAVESGQ